MSRITSNYCSYFNNPVSSWQKKLPESCLVFHDLKIHDTGVLDFNKYLLDLFYVQQTNS